MTRPSYEASLSSTCAIPEETHRASLRPPRLTVGLAARTARVLDTPSMVCILPHHLTGLDEKKALNLEDTCADTFVKSE